VQRTLLACVSAKGSLRGDSSFRTWLFTVARHELFQHLRREQRAGVPVDLAVSSIEQLVTTPGSRLARKAEHQRVLAALRQLPVEQQTLLELHYWEDLDVAELSTVFELEPGTTRVKLYRARQKLKELLAASDEDAEAQARQARPS
jgi:RNA polymerase sigma factor (sigma-70 family)